MIYILRLLLLLITLISSSGSLYGLESNWGISDASKVRLISPLSHNNNKDKIILGLEYHLEPEWKTYWQSPGEGGFPQELSWNKSTNVSSIDIDWPTPSEFEILGIKSIGYQEEVIFPLTVHLIDPQQPTSINLSINYLTCKEICIPGNANLDIEIPAGNGVPTNYFFTIEKALSSLPQRNINLTSFSGFNITTSADKEITSINLEATTKSFFYNPKLYLHTPFGLPVIEPVLDYSLDQSTLNATFYFDRELITKDSFEISALLVDQNHNFLFNTNLNINKLDNISYSNKFLFYFTIALLGGLILNVMPCVFPVLSIKLLAVLENQQKTTRISFLITSFGIVTSFILLALIFLIMQRANMTVAWGMQFQQPYYLLIIAFVLAVFMLNMFGLFEFRTPQLVYFSRFKLIGHNKFIKDFFNGFFATIMATPCSAPFVGTAITVAFTQSSFILISIFFAMGIGMSIPYLVVALFPALVSFLPKPGKWMQYVKCFLGILLLLTLIWIANIILNHFNYYFIIASIFLLIVIIFFTIRYSQSFIFIVITLFIFLSLPLFSFFKQQHYETVGEGWQDFFAIQIEDLISNNEIVFLDITADWCATCQFNKINVLNNKEVIKAFNKNNIIKVRADWTRPNKQIDMFLNKHNRFGIPFNAFFSKNYPRGIILSELLSEKKILEAIKQIKQ